MEQDKMREEYERLTGRYWLPAAGVDTQVIWAMAWNASRAAVVVELPTVDGKSLTATACRIILNKCRDAIKAAGIRTK